MLDRVQLFVEKYKLQIAFLIILLPFVLVRLPFFLHYPFIGFYSDSFGYFQVVDQIEQGLLPRIEIRSIGYPAFLWLNHHLFGTNMSVVYVQTIISLLVLLYAVHTIFKAFPKYVFISTVILGAYGSSNQFVEYGMALLTESLYVSFIILFWCFVLKAIISKQSRYFLYSSISLAIIILVRPAGLYLVPIIILLVIYLLYRRYAMKSIASLILPFLGVVLLYCSYVKYTAGVFALSQFGPVNLFAYLGPILEKDKSYPEGLNKAIEKYKAGIPEEDSKIIHKSLKLPYVAYLQEKYYNTYWVMVNHMVMDSTLFNPDTLKPNQSPMNFLLPIMRKVSYDIIAKKPLIYTKLVASNFIKYYFFNTEPGSLHHSIAHNYYNLYLKHENWDTLVKTIPRPMHIRLTSEYYNILSVEKGIDKRYYKEFLEPLNCKNNIMVADSGLISENLDGVKVTIYNQNLIMKPFFSNGPSIFIQSLLNLLFYNPIAGFLFGLTFFMTLLYCFWLNIRSKFSNELMVACFLFMLSALAHGTLVSLVESAINRYLFPMEFILTFSVLFMFILWRNSRQLKQ